MPLDSELVTRARELARLAHADHLRKAPKVPYFEHLDGVARILDEHGYDDDVTLAAAYLHDLLEDRPSFSDRLRSEMPAEVVRVVEVLTEQKEDARGRHRPKKARFEGYVRGLSAPTPIAERARPISCADKIHNTRSLVDAERAGHGLLAKLSTRPGEHEAQLETLRAVYAGSVSDALMTTFDAAANALLETIEAWLPGRAVMIAAEAHLGRLDETGAPSVFRSLRRMLRAEGDAERMAAALHDVVEVGHWTLEGLIREGFSERVVLAVDHLTRREGERDEDFLERVAEDRLATRVKLLELTEDAERDRRAIDRRAIDRLEAELRKRSLFVVLDAPSAEAARRRAVHPVVRSDHVTLAHRVDPQSVDPAAFVPGASEGDAVVGQTVELQALSEHTSDRVQALVVALGGTTTRPFDGGTLHVTVSRAAQARSAESNDLIAETDGVPIEGGLPLRGRVEWVDR